MLITDDIHHIHSDITTENIVVHVFWCETYVYTECMEMVKDEELAQKNAVILRVHITAWHVKHIAYQSVVISKHPKSSAIIIH